MAIAFTQSVSDMRLDNMRVTFDGAEIGTTMGGVEINIVTSFLEVSGDQYGTTPLNTFSTGDRVTVKFARFSSSGGEILVEWRRRGAVDDA